MEETDDQLPPEAPREPGLRAWFLAMPRWKKVMLGAGVATTVLGGVLLLASGDAPPPAGGGPRGGSGLGAQFAPGGSQPGTTAPGEEPAAQGVFRLGSSLVAGFCIGAFVRAAVKTVAIVVGFFLVGMFLLERAAFVVVDWTAIDAAWNGFWSKVGDEWGDFTRFATGRLPAAGLATFGLYAGFRR
jgi:uncharacterized membrane protein (Fun14 family)